ncbi:hypothetical protein [Bacillus phage phiAGATE]|uniref:Uncharacterized protein n=1 Tax=Bacillus phage phiAGATE TaxID=1204533 RepID=L0L997_9CAUD|nr:hypothetical protein G380_gp078 [Bacillus phage phiAGATE]AGB62728.1 hypothetical protein [Bacillus phage phiAGATE]
MKDRVTIPELELRVGKSGSKEEREKVVLKATSIATQIKRKERG